jgi:polysaccharide export outer membrane protein
MTDAIPVRADAPLTPLLCLLNPVPSVKETILMWLKTSFWYALRKPAESGLMGRISLLLGVFAALLVCLPAEAQDAAPATPPVEDSPPPASTPPAGAGTTYDESSQYIIGPGDTLQIFVWRNPELSTTVPVRPDGQISMPLVENMVAVHKTPSQLARDVEKVLAEYVRSPKVNIIVTVPVSTLSQVKIVGQVGKPQALPFREGMSVIDAVLQAGGLTQFAAGNRAKIMRTENGKQIEIRVKLGDLLNGGDMKQNVTLKPGDVLVIPQSFF